ncbi:hypothetical protein MKW98_013448 [Papaver atlanticum]|uniref:Disease resistance protein n=1 Tax=Papaver atlanticum TaxID=357466 RepID=A0AAD4XKV6_9MAGN|nr:hypothetical protein MKW98_013448 [Papaver atlanticum]
MAEGAVVKILLETVKNLIMDEAYFLLGVEGKIESLQRDLEWMSASITEAGETLKSGQKLKVWVKQLRGIIFESEDVIDDFILEIVHPKRFQKDPKALTAVRTVLQLPSVHKYGKRIQKINTRVKELQDNNKKFGFEISANTTGGSAGSSNQLTSPSLQQRIKARRAAIAAEEIEDAIDIHGDSVRQVMSLLRGDKGDALRIISIVGMGGVGKTALSRKVFMNVMDNFDCLAFVYISKEYISQKHKKIIMDKCFPSISCEGELSNKRLYEHLKEKKYLIVLDDLWDTQAWNDLKSSFPNVDNGSRVLLTTRHKGVANTASSSSNTDIHKLAAINDVEGRELFLKKIFPSNSIITSEQFVRSIDGGDLVKQMVEKCCGLPLAVDVLGSLLSSEEKSRHKWRKVNEDASLHLSQVDSEHYYECSGILALSYDYLPQHLKPCFLYMSLFPEAREISATRLFQYWIAEGFIEDTGKSLEDTAEDYLEELIKRSLVQVSKFRCDGIRVKTCRVHNLLRHISVTESECDQFSQMYGSIDELYKIQNRSRRVAVYSKIDVTNEQHISKFRYTRIRSLMCQRVRFTEGTYLSSLFGGFKSLRVLEFYGYTEGRVSLPKEVGELIHLRYLSLENTKLEKIGTGCLSKLVNLETLNLKDCIGKLKLDDEIWRLCQLRNLYLVNITPENKSSGWKGTIDKLDIGDLANLQLLVIQAGDWIDSGGLKRLNSLRKLRIENCLSSHSVEISKAIANFTNLESLVLTSKNSSTPLPLAPIQFSSHKSLLRLHLKGNILGWTGSISFPTMLCKLRLEWSRIEKDPMPILEKLPSLTFLHLGLYAYEGKRMVCSGGGFARLQTLEIVSSENLEEWIIEDKALKSLASLEICNCQNLEMIPDGLQQLTTLKNLTVVNMPHLQSRMTEEVGEDWNKIQHVPESGRRVYGY